MKKQLTVQEWTDALADGLEYRRDYGRENEWSKMESLFYQANRDQQNNTSENIIASVGDSLLSHLTVPNPYYVLSPLRLDCVEATPVLERQLNVLLYSMGMKPEMEKAVLHTYLYGRGILKLGFDSEWGYSPQLDLGKSAEAVLGMSVSQFGKEGQRIEYNSRVAPGMPWVEAVLPHDFVVPTGVCDLAKAPWAAHRVVRHIDDLRADKKYENTRGLEPSLSMSDWVKSYLTVVKPYRAGTEWSSGKGRGEGKVEFVELWEIHDARTGRVYTVAQGYDEFLRNEIDYLQEDGLPFISLTFTPPSRTFWNTSTAVYLKSHQDELLDISTVQRIQRRVSLLRFFVEEGALDNDELEKYLTGKIGTVVKFRAGASQTPIIPATPMNSNNQLSIEAEEVRKNSRATVGLGRNQAGEYEQKSRISATEVSTVQAGADQRLDRRDSALADCYCEVGKKLSSLIVKFWRTPRVIQMVGASGAAEWVTFSGGDLRGEYQYKVGFSSEPVESKAGREQKMLSVLQTLPVLSQLAVDPSLNQIELRRYFVRQFNDPQIDKLFVPGVIVQGVQPDANLPVQMPGMQSPGGAPQPSSVNGGAGARGPGPGVQLPAQQPLPAGPRVQNPAAGGASVGPRQRV